MSTRINRCPICGSSISGVTTQPIEYCLIDLHLDGGADLLESDEADGSETELFCEGDKGTRHTTDDMAQHLVRKIKGEGVKP